MLDPAVKGLNPFHKLKPKAQGIERTYPKAIPQDLKRLTSETMEDSYSRVEWTNPKDGKIYNLLKQGETKDGKVVVRILDEQGAFVKNAELTPKKIVMVDAHTDVSSFDHNELTHANAVYKYIKRNNPFAKIEYHDVTKQTSTFNGYKCDIDSSKLAQAYNYIGDSIKQGEKIDYVTTSIGNEVSEDMDKFVAHFVDVDALKELSLASKGKTRIIFSSGNDGALKSNVFLSAETAAGVGALTPQGKITSFSASRNSKYTQHYEQGEFDIRATEYGYNITGRPGTDIPYPNNLTQTEIKKINEAYEKMQAKWENIRQRVNKLQSYSIMRQEDHIKRYNLLEDIFYRSAQKYKACEQKHKEILNIVERINCLLKDKVIGTSFSTPIRTAKLALNDMMRDVL